MNRLLRLARPAAASAGRAFARAALDRGLPATGRRAAVGGAFLLALCGAELAACCVLLTVLAWRLAGDRQPAPNPARRP